MFYERKLSDWEDASKKGDRIIVLGWSRDNGAVTYTVQKSPFGHVYLILVCTGTEPQYAMKGSEMRAIERLMSGRPISDRRKDSPTETDISTQQ